MNILLVSGFLGAGKTTFIKELIKKTSAMIAILENEYGDTSLDKEEIQNGTDIDVVEFMDGCVCCSKKDSFANTIVAISASINPDCLVVEPTGISKLGNLIANIKKVEWENIRLVKPILIITPRSYYNNMKEYPEIYSDQIKYASIVFFSKIDNEDIKLLDSVKKSIREINRNVIIIDEPYKNMDKKWFENLLYTEIQIDKNIKEDFKQEEIDQFTIKKAKIDSIEKLVIFLESLIRGRYGDIVRAKGNIRCQKNMYRFDVADGLYAITGYVADEELNQCVFIGKSIKRDFIRKIFKNEKSKTVRRRKINK